MSEYSGAIAATDRAITKKGKSVTFTKTSGGTRDPATGETTGGTTQSMTIKAVVLPASGGKTAALDLRYGNSLDLSTVQKLAFLLIDGADCTFEPEPATKVTIGSEVWTVLGTTPLNPNEGDPILHKVAIRI